MRAPVRRGETRALAWRLEQLQRLERLLEEHREEVHRALEADLGRPAPEAAIERSSVLQELRLARRRLRAWMRPRRVALPFWAWPGSASTQPEPLGCVLIIGPWNYPFQLCLKPLVSALAAGNTAVLKPSEHAPATAALLARLIARHFPPQTVQVVLGDGGVAARLLEERFDHIFFTGSGRVGRLVMAAAARHLTPVTLELGGKSPAIVLADADVEVTARRLVWGKTVNAGQTCIAPDHLLVVPALREALLAAMATEIRRFHGDDPLASPDLGRIVNRARFDRLEELLAGARSEGRVLLGGRSDLQRLRIEPTLIAVDDACGDPLMQEELFGPLLPVLEVADLEEALERVRAGVSPLALYLFSRSAAAGRQLLATSLSGGVAFNEVILQAGLPGLPFGGVGESGMGSAHGEAGFLAFSHQRSVLSRPFRFDLPLRYPPYAGKLPWLEKLLG
ncbi:MAG: aldehyde dehydrogenase family protein [Cyanobium sp.]